MTEAECRSAKFFAGCDPGTQQGLNAKGECGCWPVQGRIGTHWCQLSGNENRPECDSFYGRTPVGTEGAYRPPVRTLQDDALQIALIAGGVVLGLFVLRGLFRFLRD